MAFTQSTFAPVGAHSANTPNLYSYMSADTMAVIAAPSYFFDKRFQLNEGDFMIIQASDGSGMYQVDSTNQGVQIVGESAQTTAFGEALVAMNNPVEQFTFQYGIPGRTFLVQNNSATVASVNSEVVCNTGTTTNSLAVFRSERALIYKGGQGGMARFTGRFTTGIAGTGQRLGLLSNTDGLCFGYDGDQFGVLRRHHGEREVQTLTVSSGAGGSESATITVDGTGYTVPLTAGTVQHNAQEIAASLNSQLFLWDAEQIDDIVRIVSIIDGNYAGSFAFSSATAAASWAETVAGVDVTDNWVYQADWNGATMSSFDPTKGNVFQIDFQYLGYGGIQFYIEDPDSNKFELVHTIKYANSNIEPSLGNPAMFISAVAENLATTEDITLSSGSMAMFTQGERKLIGTGRAKDNTKTSVDTTLTNILTISNSLFFKEKGSLAEMLPQLVTASTDSTKGAVIEVIANATLGGSPNFQFVDEEGSIAHYDTAGTTVTAGRLVQSLTLGPAGSDSVDLSKLNEVLLPGETLTIAGKVTASPASDITVTATWEEDV